MEARYIDDLVARRRDANKDGDYSDSGDGIFYALTDVQFSVVAMLTSTGKLHERVAYDSYGTARHHWKDDVDGDGDVDSSDKSLVTGGSGKHIYDSGYDPGADIDRSGTIDSTDAGLVSSTTIAALASGMISDRKSGGPDNTIGYDGYVFNPENLLYTVRYRTLDTGLGRWLERDPAGYVDGMSLYDYARSSPLRYLDPSGLRAGDDDSDFLIDSQRDFRARWLLQALSWIGRSISEYEDGHPSFNDAERKVWQSLSLSERRCMRSAFKSALRFVMETDENNEVIPLGNGGGGRGPFKGTLLDGPGDAVRHCTWNCIMAHCVGSEKAKEFADAHEMSHENDDPDGKAMDLHNNQKGRELYEHTSQKMKDTRECWSVDDECYKGCKRLHFCHGELCTLDKSRWRDHGPRPDPDLLHNPIEPKPPK